MKTYKEILTENGPMKITEEITTIPWDKFLCFKCPKSCQDCPVGWRLICPVNSELKNLATDNRNKNCPLKCISVDYDINALNIGDKLYEVTSDGTVEVTVSMLEISISEDGVMHRITARTLDGRRCYYMDNAFNTIIFKKYEDAVAASIAAMSALL